MRAGSVTWASGTCVYARRTKQRIHYRVVDEYQGETLSDRRTRTSVRPLTLGELEAFFNGAWSIFTVLDCNFSDDGYDLDEMQAFVVSVDSEFYPDLEALCRHRIAAWAAERHVDDEEEEEEVDVVEALTCDKEQP